MTEPKPTTSPACSLHEADDIYAGFATADETQRMIRHWIEGAPSAEIASKLASLLPPDMAQASNATGRPNTDLRDEIIRFLPKVRQDDVHHALKQIAEGL